MKQEVMGSCLLFVTFFFTLCLDDNFQFVLPLIIPAKSIIGTYTQQWYYTSTSYMKSSAFVPKSSKASSYTLVSNLQNQ
jgi:hypothetical protein